MGEPRRWLIWSSERDKLGRRPVGNWPLIAHDASGFHRKGQEQYGIEVIEAAPVEAELERLEGANKRLQARWLEDRAELAELRHRIENASATIAAYQTATGTDYPGSLRKHQREPDLIKAGRAYREQWGIQEALDAKAELERLRKIEDLARSVVGGYDVVRRSATSEEWVNLRDLREALEER